MEAGKEALWDRHSTGVHLPRLYLILRKGVAWILQLADFSDACLFLAFLFLLLLSFLSSILLLPHGNVLPDR